MVSFGRVSSSSKLTSLINLPISYTTNSFRGSQQFSNLLKVMQLQPETVLCALFYLSKLFPCGFVFGSATPSTGIDINTLAIRMFSIGCVLATKWLQDETPTLSWWYVTFAFLFSFPSDPDLGLWNLDFPHEHLTDWRRPPSDCSTTTSASQRASSARGTWTYTGILH